MKSRTKLSLLSNYVEIYKILYQCKTYIKKAIDIDTIKEFKALTISTIKLKNRYEEIFKTCGIEDDSFLLLKMQLNDALLNDYSPQVLHSPNFEILNLKRQSIESDLTRLLIR